MKNATLQVILLRKYTTVTTWLKGAKMRMKINLCKQMMTTLTTGTNPLIRSYASGNALGLIGRS